MKPQTSPWLELQGGALFTLSDADRLQKESTKEPMPFPLIGCRRKMRHETNCESGNFE